MSRRIRAAAGSVVLAVACGVGGWSGELSEPALWLQRYLQIDTSNPPGREAAAASFLGELLHREGIATRRIVAPGERVSLYARLEAEEPAEGALLLLHHMDVVPPGPGWTADPFAGEVEEGVLWGRGAVDDKSLGIAHLVAFLELKRRGRPLERDVIFLAVADEETGSRLGTAWLLEQHPELFAGVDAVLTEGGSNRAFRGRQHWWGIEVAQKRPLWLRVTAHGRGGHGSTLNLHSAPHRLLRSTHRLLERPLDFRLTPEARQYLEAVAPYESLRLQELVLQLDEIIAAPRPEAQLLPGLPNFFLDSIQVNVLEAGEKLNVVPWEASALVDIRLLPDADADAFLKEIRELLGDQVDVEVLLQAPRVEASPVDHPIFRCLERFLGRQAPVVPAFIPGITDARFFRAAGVPAYGVSPFVLESTDLRGIHGPDERIPLEAFDHGVETMTGLLAECAGRHEP
ncbi:MAG: M20/M25/M40 family metallo-hydrolase [Thermoanaerobaculia bacterium]